MKGLKTWVINLKKDLNNHKEKKWKKLTKKNSMELEKKNSMDN